MRGPSRTSLKSIERSFRLTDRYVLDMHDFYFRETDRIAILHADLLCIDYQGSILDACCRALLAALMDLRIPSISSTEEGVEGVPACAAALAKQMRDFL